MRCKVSRRLLSRHLDGELGLLTRSRLERHLRGCAACQAELELDRRVWKLLDAAAVARPPELVERLERRLAAEAPEPLRWGGGGRARPGGGGARGGGRRGRGRPGGGARHGGGRLGVLWGRRAGRPLPRPSSTPS
jgi:anti-sigma factor RsiW